MPPKTKPPLTAAAAKKKRQKMIIIGVAGAAILLLLYLRSKSSSSTTSTNATSATDQQAAIDQAVANQQAQDAAMYGSTGAGVSGGDLGSSGGGTFDTSGITSGLSTIDTDLQNLPGSIIAAQQASSAGTAPGSSGTETQTPQITVNVNGQPAGSGGATGPRMSTNVPKGDIAAPFGAKKPTAPKGYVAVGTGSGNWAFRPVAAAAPRTGTTSHSQPKTTKRKGP